MKYFFLLFSITLIFLGCNDSVKDKAESSNGRPNLLLPTAVSVSNLFLFETSDGLGWQKEFKSEEFINNVFDKAMVSEIDIYEPFATDSFKSSKESILSKMECSGEALNLKEIKGIFFEEEWSLDTAEPFLFEKKVKSWYPVRFFKRDELSEMKLVFRIKNEDASELLAKNVITEFMLQDTVQPDFTKNINASKLASILINKALAGKIKLWNPLDAEKELTINEVKKNLGEIADTIIHEDAETGEISKKIINTVILPEEISSIVFVEDWYYNPKTFSINKIITGIGPVRSYTKSNGDAVKSICFMMYLGKEKTKIF